MDIARSNTFYVPSNRHISSNRNIQKAKSTFFDDEHQTSSKTTNVNLTTGVNSNVGSGRNLRLPTTKFAQNSAGTSGSVPSSRRRVPSNAGEVITRQTAANVSKFAASSSKNSDYFLPALNFMSRTSANLNKFSFMSSKPDKMMHRATKSHNSSSLYELQRDLVKLVNEGSTGRILSKEHTETVQLVDPLAQYNKLEFCALKNRIMEKIHFSSMSYKYIKFPVEPDYIFPGLFRCQSKDEKLKFYVSYDQKPTPLSFHLHFIDHEFAIPKHHTYPDISWITILVVSDCSCNVHLGVCFFKKKQKFKSVDRSSNNQSVVEFDGSSEALINRMSSLADFELKKGRRELTKQTSAAKPYISLRQKKNQVIADHYRLFVQEKNQLTSEVLAARVEDTRNRAKEIAENIEISRARVTLQRQEKIVQQRKEIEDLINLGVKKTSENVFGRLLLVYRELFRIRRELQRKITVKRAMKKVRFRTRVMIAMTIFICNKSKQDRELPYTNLCMQLNVIARGLLQEHAIKRAKKIARGFFAKNFMAVKLNSEIANFSSLLRSFQLRVIRNMKRRSAAYELFLEGWNTALDRVRQLNMVFPEKKVLGIEKYWPEIQENKVLEDIFEIVWNSRLLEYLRSRIKTEVYKVSENKNDYTTWRLTLMNKQNYVNDHIGFEKIMHMEGLARFVDRHRWNETYIKAVKRTPETLISDVLGKHSPVNLIKSKLSILANPGEDSNQGNSKEELMPFKFLIGSPQPPTGKLKPKHSLSLKIASSGLSLRQLGKNLDKITNASPTKGKLMDSKFNIVQLLKKSNHTMDMGFNEKFFFNLVIATTLFFLNRDNIPF